MAFSEFEDEVLGAVAAATGTVRGGGSAPQTLFTSIDESRMSIVEFMKEGLAGKGRPEPPYVGVEIGSFTPELDLDAIGQFMRAPMRVAVIGACSMGANQESVHALLESVRARIDDPAAFFQTFCRMERGAVDSSSNNPVFRALAAESRVEIVAAVLTYSPGLLVWT